MVASFFALAETVRFMDKDVVDLTPPGVEPHDLELSAKQVDQIQDAEVVVLLGGGFQPAVERAAKRAKGKVVTIDPGDDPHIWLDPVRMQDVTRQIANAIKGDPADTLAQLEAIDIAYQAGLRDCATRTLVTAHDAFGHLARRYNLTTEPITGISPEAEPDPRRLAELTDLVKRAGVTTVFTEELVSPRVAEALAREAGIKTDVLDTLESGEPKTYFKTMQANLDKLRAALGCR